MKEMREADVRRVLQKQGLGVLALAADGDAYAIPIFYARIKDDFYFHSKHGVKDDYIEATKQACLVVMTFRDIDTWSSVQVFGHLKRLAGPEAQAAVKQLEDVPMPPEWALHRGEPPKRGRQGTFVWRLSASKVVGRKSEPSYR